MEKSLAAGDNVHRELQYRLDRDQMNRQNEVSKLEEQFEMMTKERDILKTQLEFKCLEVQMMKKGSASPASIPGRHVWSEAKAGTPVLTMSRRQNVDVAGKSPGKPFLHSR